MRHFYLIFLHFIISTAFAQSKEGILIAVPETVVTHVLSFTPEGNWVSVSATESGTLFLNVFESDGSQLRFSKTINPGYNFKLGALAIKDGIFYVAGKGVVNPQNNMDGVLLKIDEKGEIIGSSVLGGDGYDGIEQLIITSEGNLIFCGTSENGPKGKDAWAGMINLDLNPIWQSRFGWQMEEVAFDIIERKDGTFLIGGSTTSKGAGLKDMVLFDIDQTGLMLWGRVYGKPDASEILYKIREMEDTTLVLAGSSQRENPIGLVYKTNSQGSVEWSLKTGSTSSQRLNDIAVDDGKSGIRIYGNSGIGKNEIPAGWMILVDKQGKIVQEVSEEGILFSDCSNSNPVKIAGIELTKGSPFIGNGLKVGKLSNALSVTPMIAMAENPETSLLAGTKKNNEENQLSTPVVLPEENLGEGDSLEENPVVVQAGVSSHSEKTDLIPGKEKNESGISTEKEHYTIDHFKESDIESTKDSLRKNYSEQIIKEESPDIPKTGFLYCLSYGISQTSDNQNTNTEAENDARKLSDFFTMLRNSVFHNIYPGIIKGSEAKTQNLKSAMLTVRPSIGDSDVFMFYANTELIAVDSFTLALNTQEVIQSGNLRQAFTLNALVKSLIVMKGEKIVMLDLYCPEVALWEFYRKQITEAFEDTEQITVLITFQSKAAKELQEMEQVRFVPEAIMRGISVLADRNQDKVVTLYEFCDYVENGLPGSARNFILPMTLIRTAMDFPLIFPE